MRYPVVLLGLFLVGCPSGPDYPETPTPPDTNLCGKMCDHLSKLGCDEAKAVYDIDMPGPPDVPNVTCQAFCERLQKRGTFQNPRCVLEVKSCDGIERARQRDPNACGGK